MRKHGSLTQDEEVNEAAWVAGRGAAVGAAKWGIFSAIAAGVGMMYSPLYRGTTIPFKVFLQMSGMTLGSIIEADHRLIAHGKTVRARKKMAKDAEVWRRFEEDYGSLDSVSSKDEPKK
ncbi:unnamed protein product [Zymoseptoria tritici ST99CH_1A5]|uniref:Imidazoleglycerol-phosphate dehydratase n=4 Tax=Zymoseptoria tritici TaxID=1047171 RepID=F9XIK1_ZYMTI|nr:uncharacterized protein MYCGRDRAFT_46828 [Zymoseptoria tritici IPO323]SMQ53538.1 unnamed protein product [Zymoseptoria tritici ST99CH_3D7]SMR57117.1 unnamed protein product [Zymoseptoria tritici ST99CH_1E4]SMR59987.1 unnamed protein product [Zymoseptoria tritici ST99CH_3D1]SMY27171.1 unnamed protein product [Zymoseptoria tritici ST99CH_1A5]EGP85085.1 hypothetical protein MYCGRDRAFT_46828 [Zymoseptoria tritici IPO323]